MKKNESIQARPEIIGRGLSRLLSKGVLGRNDGPKTAQLQKIFEKQTRLPFLSLLEAIWPNKGEKEACTLFCGFKKRLNKQLETANIPIRLCHHQDNRFLSDKRVWFCEVLSEEERKAREEEEKSAQEVVRIIEQWQKIDYLDTPASEYIPQEVEKMSTLQEFAKEKVQKMARNLRKVKKGGKIKILCGEGNHRVYNQQKVIDALRRAKDAKKATIQVVIGPVVSTDNMGRNGLLELEEEEKIDKIYYRPQRGALFHFGVFEKEGTEEGAYSFLDIEMPHRCLASGEERRKPDLPLEGKEPEEQFWADKFSVDFDYWVDELKKESPKEGIPIKFTDEQFNNLLTAIEKDDKDFNFLGTEELLRYKEKILQG